MNTYYYYSFNIKQTLIMIVYCVTDDIIFTTNLKQKTVTLNFNNTVLPTDKKEINYNDYLRLLTYYNCIS